MGEIFWIIILIMIASSIFNRVSNQQRKNSETSKRAPSRQNNPGNSGKPSPENQKQNAGGQGTFKDQVQEMLEEMTGQSAHPTQRAPQAEDELYQEEGIELSDTHDEYAKQMENLRKRKEEAEKRMDDVDSPIFQRSARRNTRSEREGQVAISFRDLEREDVVKGIVWSEVIGPPRAGHPPRSRRAYTRK